MSTSSAQDGDTEYLAADTHLFNDTVYTLSWKSVSITVHDKNAKEDKHILSGIDGSVKAGKDAKGKGE